MWGGTPQPPTLFRPQNDHTKFSSSFCVIILWAPPTRLILTASVGGIPPNPPHSGGWGFLKWRFFAPQKIFGLCPKTSFQKFWQSQNPVSAVFCSAKNFWAKECDLRSHSFARASVLFHKTRARFAQKPPDFREAKTTAKNFWAKECGGLGGIPPTLAVRLVGGAHKTITLFR